MKCPKNPRSRKWRRIVNRGCGGYRDYWGEYDCHHGYDWTCDDCPVCQESQRKNRKAVEDTITLLFSKVD